MQKKIPSTFSINFITNYSIFHKEYLFSLKYFIYYIKNLKNKISIQMNIIQEDFNNFLNLPSKKKDLLKIFMKKYENFVEKFSLIKKNRIVNYEFNQDIIELTEHYWTLIEMKKRDSIEEKNVLKKNSFIDKEIEKFFEEIKKIFKIEVEKFINILNNLYDFYFWFDPNKLNIIRDSNINLNIENNNNNNENINLNPFIFKYNIDEIFNDIEINNHTSIYNNNNDNNNSNKENIVKIIYTKIEKIYFNCIKILFKYDIYINTLQKNFKEKYSILNTTSNSFSTIRTKHKGRRKSDVLENSSLEIKNPIVYEEELKSSINQEKIKYKFRLTSLLNFAKNFLINLKSLEKKTFDILDNNIIESVKFQNNIMNSLMADFKLQINLGENHLHYKINNLDGKNFKKTKIKFDEFKKEKLELFNNNNISLINFKELKNIYNEIKSFEIQKNFVSFNNVFNIIYKKYSIESKSSAFLNYYHMLPFKYINNFFERIKKKNKYENEYVNIKELFNYLALMNVIIFNKNFESEIEDNIKNKLKYHCFLDKNEFLDENILWFENDFNKKYIKELKEFLFMINKEENNINFDIDNENNNNINEEGENLKEEENLNNNKNEENNEIDNNNNNKTNIEMPIEERINFKEFLNIVKLKYVNKNVKKILNDDNNELELNEDEEYEENEDNINEENEVNNNIKLKENSKNISNLNENIINDDNNNNIDLENINNNNNLLTLEDENDFTYFDYLFS